MTLAIPPALAVEQFRYRAAVTSRTAAWQAIKRQLVFFQDADPAPLTPDVLDRRRNGFGHAFRRRVEREFGRGVEMRLVDVVGEEADREPEPPPLPHESDRRGIRLTGFPALNAMLVEARVGVGRYLHHRKHLHREIVVAAPRRFFSASRPERNQALKCELQDLWHLNQDGDVRDRDAGKSTWIGFIDSGIDAGHPEFAGQLAGGGLIHRRVSRAGELYRPHHATDVDGHGTFCAALACGKNCGVAPAASIVMVAAPLDPTQANADVLQQVLVGLEYILTVDCRRPDGRLGVDVINMSFGVYEPPLAIALRRGFEQLRRDFRSKILCAASGNAPVGMNPVGLAHTPATVRGVWGIGAHTRGLQIWPRSCSGVAGSHRRPRVVPKYYAPGVDLVSALSGGGYARASGTSMACAVASGVAAATLAAGQPAEGLTPKTRMFKIGTTRLRRIVC